MVGDATFGGNVNLVSSLSVRHVAHFGSSLSLLQISRLGSSLSVLDFLHIGSSLALRSFARCGSSVSLLNFCSVGSSLAMRSFMRLGASMSLLGKARFGSTLAVGGNLHLGAAIYFNGPGTYLQYDAGATELRLHAGGLKRLSISSTGGSLHGTWSSESIISASDQRLKRRIEPLERALAARAPAAQESQGSDKDRAVGWLLRELRPVSYHFKEGPEAKLARYGFIAQELEKVMPELVRDHKDRKHVVYQDLVALLTLASQVQQDRLEAYEARARKRAAKLKDQGSLLTKLSRAVTRLTARITRWEKSRPPRAER